MKKIITTIIFSLISTVSLADGHSGKIDLEGFFQADAKFIFDDKGIGTYVYDGMGGLRAMRGSSFGDSSSGYCVGAGSIPGKGVEMGHCTMKFIDGDTAMIYIEIPLDNTMGGKFECLSGTGRYEGITCSGDMGYQQIKSAVESKIHSTNYYKGTYTLKK